MSLSSMICWVWFELESTDETIFSAYFIPFWKFDFLIDYPGSRTGAGTGSNEIVSSGSWMPSARPEPPVDDADCWDAVVAQQLAVENVHID